MLQVIQNMLKVSSTRLLGPKTLDIMVDPVSRVCPTVRQVVHGYAVPAGSFAAAGNCKPAFCPWLLPLVSEHMAL